LFSILDADNQHETDNVDNILFVVDINTLKTIAILGALVQFTAVDWTFILSSSPGYG
jgi:hypothetical protein